MSEEEKAISKIWLELQTKLRREEANENIQTFENRTVSLRNQD